MSIDTAAEARTARRAALEASLRDVLFQIIRFVNEKKDHIPPIPNLEGVSFPYEITISRYFLLLSVAHRTDANTCRLLVYYCQMNSYMMIIRRNRLLLYPEARLGVLNLSFKLQIDFNIFVTLYCKLKSLKKLGTAWCGQADVCIHFSPGWW